MPKTSFFKISSQRRLVVEQDVREGSDPQPRFFIMVALSTMIAALGLITNSSAVVIGAMLVAPLMTPIFGIALALIQGDSVLMGKSIKAEVLGVAGALLMSYLLGLLVPALEPTDEMISRATPNLYDLLIAIFAGTAGAYAVIDEKISPVLTGIAISTAIVPPLANTGLCLAIGAYKGSLGSFVLFFSNFLSILLVASVTFHLFGMAKRWSKSKSVRDVFKSLTWIIICFLFVTVFLSHSLANMLDRRMTKIAVRDFFTEEFNSIPSVHMDKMYFDLQNNEVSVLVQLQTQQIFSSRQVKKIEYKLAKKLNRKVHLVVRSALSADVSSGGELEGVVKQSLNGLTTDYKSHPNVIKTEIAENIIRDFFSLEISVDLYGMTLLNLNDKQLVMATICTVRNISQQDIVELQQRIRKEIGEDNLYLMLRVINYHLYSQSGEVRYEWLSFGMFSSEDESIVSTAENFIMDEIKKKDSLILNNITATKLEDEYVFLIEVLGTRELKPKIVEELENRTAENINGNVKIFVWYKNEYVVTSSGYSTYEEASDKIFQDQKQGFSRQIIKIFDSSF